METENVNGMVEPAVKTKSPFSKEQQKQIVAELNAGAKAADLMVKYNIPSNSTIYTWRKVLEGSQHKKENLKPQIQRRVLKTFLSLADTPMK